MSRVRLGIIGCGAIAANHGRAIRELADRAQLTCAVDADAARAEAFAREFGAPRWGTDAEVACRSGGMDAVILCLPHHLHVPATRAALEAGLHVLCEKPFARDLVAGAALVAEAARRGLCLAVGYTRRFFPEVLETRELLASAAIGSLRHVSASYLHRHEWMPKPWHASAEQNGGYLLPLLGSHFLDLILWLTGGRVQRLACELAVNDPRWGGEDEAAVTLTLGLPECRRLPVSLRLSACCLPGGPEGASRNELLLGFEKTTLTLSVRRLLKDGEPVDLAAHPQDPFTGQLRAFLQALHSPEDPSPLCDGTQALRVAALLNACQEAARQGNTIADIHPYGTEHFLKDCIFFC